MFWDAVLNSSWMNLPLKNSSHTYFSPVMLANSRRYVLYKLQVTFKYYTLKLTCQFAELKPSTHHKASDKEFNLTVFIIKIQQRF